MCRLHLFVLESHLATLWESKCPSAFCSDFSIRVQGFRVCVCPFDVSDGRCGIIVSIPDHCLPFYFGGYYFLIKKCLYNVDPLNPTLIIIVKLGFTGVYIIFLISAQKHRLWVPVRTASPRRF